MGTSFRHGDLQLACAHIIPIQQVLSRKKEARTMLKSVIQGYHGLLISLVLLESRLVSSQQTTSSLSCMIHDEKDNVYDISLARGSHELLCKDVQGLQDTAKRLVNQGDQTHTNVQSLRTLLHKLETRNEELHQLLSTAQYQLKHTKEALTLENQVTTECPPMYSLRSEEFKSCYMFSDRQLNWYDAESFCMNTGGHLVALETEEEQEYLIEYIKTQNVLPGKHLWTGGNDIAKENVWMWAGINVAFNYTRWLLYPHIEHGFIQMPDDYLHIEHCVHLFHLHDYDWNDLYCRNLHYFLCEYKFIDK